jgi:hypothetical protein
MRIQSCDCILYIDSGAQVFPQHDAVLNATTGMGLTLQLVAMTRVQACQHPS